MHMECEDCQSMIKRRFAKTGGKTGHMHRLPLGIMRLISSYQQKPFSLNSERRIIMDRLHLTESEESELLTILERYLPELESEIANTDRKEFRNELKVREAFMSDLINRLKH